ncbi:pyruvate dehydrogenase complex dihydrolipoamide acetyltransferase component (E2) [Entomortierella beljakovae]|nr:pyruvate dehydrogenase complex dihydrolipoamide acetyltransferase component (E2) [Entomortierella beljakovae]
MISSASVSRAALSAGRRTVQRAAVTLLPASRSTVSRSTARTFSATPSAPRYILTATSATLKSNLSRYYSAKSFPKHTVINMPALSPTMTAGNIGEWQKKVGDAITPGDVLVEIETDKAQMDFECQEEGYLAQILAESGSKEVDISRPIAILVEDKDDVEKFANFTVNDIAGAAPKKEEKKEEPAKPKAEAPKAQEAPKQTSSVNAAPQSDADRIFASPIAKKLANEKNIDLGDIVGTGPGGRIVKSDRLSESKQTIPHYYVTVEMEMGKVMKLREVLNSTSEDKYKLSVNDFIVKASALSLKDVPEANSSWLNDTIRQYHNADICIATSTPSGLITPIVASAETKGLATISNQVKDLAARARANKLAPQEYQGAEKRVVPADDGEIRTATVMAVTLSSDHRTVDGAVAARFLKAFKGYIENPLKMLL